MKTITKGKYTLEHSIVEGIFGQPQDFFEVTWIDGTGMKNCVPVPPPIRLNVTDLVFEPLRPYSDEEYNDLLDSFVSKIDGEYCKIANKMFKLKGGSWVVTAYGKDGSTSWMFNSKKDAEEWLKKLNNK